MAKYTIDSLTPKQRAIYDLMPIGVWVKPRASVTMSAIERMGLIESTREHVGKSYGRVMESRYRRNA
jgi:hypothetical protein